MPYRFKDEGTRGETPLRKTNESQTLLNRQTVFQQSYCIHLFHHGHHSN
jgi:hypothetical protein